MWQSQDDIVKDLASLNDFGNPEDKEPYKVLYSIGRGSKFKEKNKSSGQFVDSRTGEVIDVEDEILDNDFCYKGRGRGSLLGGFSRSKFQLQQQLRLARPLGSSDEAIESYCRRNEPKENPRNKPTVFDLKMNPKSGQTITGNLNLDRKKHRIKAVRNSSKDSNALISGLLTKCNKNSEIPLTSKERNFIRNEENLNETLNVNNDSVNSRDSGSIVDCNEFSTEKSACLKDTLSSDNKTPKSSREAQVVNIETPNYSIKEKKEKQNEEIIEIKSSQNYSENNFYDSCKMQHERNEKYRLLGEKLNRLRKTDPKASESGMYDISEISRYIAPIDTDFEANSITVIATNPAPTSYTVKDEDFPPLL